MSQYDKKVLQIRISGFIVAFVASLLVYTCQGKVRWCVRCNYLKQTISINENQPVLSLTRKMWNFGITSLCIVTCTAVSSIRELEINAVSNYSASGSEISSVTKRFRKLLCKNVGLKTLQRQRACKSHSSPHAHWMTR